MINILKLIAYVVVIACATSMLWLWYKTYIIGMMYASATIFVSVIAVPMPIVVIGLAALTIKSIYKLKITK